MTEKNIFVTSGRPFTPPSSGGGGSGNYAGLPSEPSSTRPTAGVEFMYQSLTDQAEELLFDSSMASRKYYADEQKKIPERASKKIADIESKVSSSTGKPVDKAQLRIYNITKIMVENSNTYVEKVNAAKAFDGADPILGWRYSYGDYGPEFYQSVFVWKDSLRAAYEAKLLVEENDILYTHLVAANGMLATAQAAEAAEIAAKSEAQAKLLRDAEEQARLGQYPATPPGVSLDQNLQEALNQYKQNPGSPLVYTWFYLKVRNSGPWDYKQIARLHENFGNFNYGATGTAAGIPDIVLLRAAGAAQRVAGSSSADFGKWWSEEPYGDDPVDQVWIKAGIDYAKSKGY
jgi:hypothetical protein